MWTCQGLYEELPLPRDATYKGAQGEGLGVQLRPQPCFPLPPPSCPLLLSLPPRETE